MKTPDSLNMVAEFHRTFQHPILPSPTIPDESRAKLRISLLAEELKELEEAVANKDIVEVADALCDLQYVLAGAILEFGLGDKFKDLFEEVQRSNMSKACNSVQEAEATILHIKEHKQVEAYYKEAEGKYLIYRKEDHKTLKSIYYSPAELAKLI